VFKKKKKKEEFKMAQALINAQHQVNLATLPAFPLKSGLLLLTCDP
jgi:hypothetical protein